MAGSTRHLVDERVYIRVARVLARWLVWSLVGGSRAGSRGFLQTVLRVRTLIIGLFLCCVALMLFQTKLVTVTEELNSRLRREVATLVKGVARVHADLAQQMVRSTLLSAACAP